MLVDLGVQEPFIAADLPLSVDKSGRSGKQFRPIHTLHLRSRQPTVVECHWEDTSGIPNERVLSPPRRWQLADGRIRGCN
jgi:hypothetical protein